MRRSLTLVLAGAISWSLIGQASAQVADPTGVIASDNVTLLTTLPNPGVIGARFKGDVMYVTSTTGLTTYDVSDPEAPSELGRLPLPHFENEDVDLGGNILLISNDSAESAGILYVIDIADPAAPAIRSILPLSGNSNAVMAQFFGGPGHTASCILECRFAWLSDGGGIRVIDLRDPSAPKEMGTFPVATGGLVVHDVQVDANGLAWIAGFGGTSAYRIPADYTGAGIGQLVVSTNAQGASRYGETFGLDDGSTYNDFIHHNSHRRANDSVVFITEEDYTRPGCRGAGSFEAWSLPVDELGNPTGAQMTPLDKWETELLADTAQPAAMCSAHYFDLRSNIVAQGWYEQGVRFLDVSNPADIRQIGYYILPGNVMWASYWAPTDPRGRIVYALDNAHGIDVLELDRPTSGPLAEPTECTPKTPNNGSSNGKGKKKGHDKPACEASGSGSEPVEAPILAAWTAGAPAAAPSRSFGFACRIAR